MIEKIIMDGVDSFKDKVEIKDLRKYSFFYGLNGTGKTSISRYLASFEKDNNNAKNGRDLSKCSIEGEVNQDNILVYNEPFIQENFVETNKQKGIFRLNKENIKVRDNIEEKKDEIEKLDKQKEGKEGEINGYRKDLDDKKTQFQGKVWCLQGDYPLCTEGYRNSKDRFLEKLLENSEKDVEKVDCIDKKLESLEGEIKELSEKDIEPKSTISPIDTDFTKIENDEIFDAVITGSSNTYLTELVTKLNHSDWVTQGIDSYLDNTDDCPFCKRAMDADLKEKIKAYIDNSYQEKIAKLKQFQEKYTMDIDNSDQYEEIGIDDKIKALQATYEANTQKIKNKIKEPSQEIKLGTTKSLIDEINEKIKEQNGRIEAFNEKIKQGKNSIEVNKKQAWGYFYLKHQGDIVNYKKEKKEIEKKKQKAEQEKTTLATDISSLKAEISSLQGSTKNIDQSINNINKHLKECGLSGFQIERIEEQDTVSSYRIVRNGEKEAVFKSLSEGEKTLVTFLYFIELCCGTNDDKENIDLSNRVIVIDDPISSLATNLVFEVSELIFKYFINKKAIYQQVILLTHHLYFFHEFTKERNGLQIEGEEKNGETKKKNVNYYRITKCEASNVVDLDPKKIRNNYESYWVIIKEIQQDKDGKHQVMLLNAMRNVLEYFFAFLKPKEKLQGILDSMNKENSSVTFKAFKKYMDRGSHSDSNTIIDTELGSQEQYFEYFQQTFDKGGQEAHYEEMMNFTKCGKK